MSGRVYRLTRDLHLYLGLFISPFVLVFSISVFFLVHSWLPRLASETSTTRVVSALPLPGDLQRLSGRPLIDALKPALEKADVRGEVGFVRHLVKEEKLIIPVTIPGRETTVSISIASREATVVTRERGLADALVTLHKSPGQHGPDIRMNWFYMKAWRWMADATVYLILFISVSGIYLWYVLRAERTVGWILLFAGALSFFGMAYALSH
ncbi:MAG: PepSY-associated TM helix domain-containing protein [Limisphaerales bacterium]